MVKVSQIIAELKVGPLRKYNDKGLLNEDLMYIYAEDAIKKFGRYTRVLRSKVITFKNFKATLPEHTFSIYSLIKCDKEGYNIVEGDKSELVKHNIWREQVVMNQDWNECDPCCVTESTSIISEKFYYQENEVDFYYRKSEPFHFTRKLLRSELCSSDCYNRKVSESPYSVRFEGRTLYANVSDVDAELIYRTLETDEDGDLVIKESEKGTSVLFVRTYILARVLEDIVTNGDGDSYTMFQMNDQRSQALFSKAFSEFTNDYVSNKDLEEYQLLRKYKARRKQVIR